MGAASLVEVPCISQSKHTLCDSLMHDPHTLSVIMWRNSSKTRERVLSLCHSLAYHRRRSSWYSTARWGEMLCRPESSLSTTFASCSRIRNSLKWNYCTAVRTTPVRRQQRERRPQSMYLGCTWGSLPARPRETTTTIVRRCNVLP